MRVQDIQALYEYHQWATDKLLATVATVDMPALHVDLHNGIGSIHTTLIHILNGMCIWRMRWQGATPSAILNPNDFPTLESIVTRWQEEQRQMQSLLEQLQDADLEPVITYASTALPGKILAFPLWQQMVHQINHATQHRSEIAMRLTELGHSPGELGMSVFFPLQGQ